MPSRQDGYASSPVGQWRSSRHRPLSHLERGAVICVDTGLASGTVALEMVTELEDSPSDRLGVAIRPRRGRRRILAVVGVLVVAFVVASIPLFVWPGDSAPPHADAIIMFNGSGDRLHTAVRLARAHVAPNLVVSRSSQYWVEGQRCAPQIPGVTVTCFLPSPATTQGEAEFAAGLAARFHWHSIILVSSRPQQLRARLRMQRCFDGPTHSVSAGLAAWRWPGAVVYEWLAMGKALIWQRGC
jgi:hypothetical protein